MNYNPAKYKIDKLAVLGGYLLAVILMTYPAVFKLNDIIGPPEDNQMFIWNMWWFKYALINLKVSPFFTRYLFYPDGASLLFHTFSPLNCALAMILQPFFKLNVTYNLLILSTFIIAAYGMFLLCRELGFSPIASFMGGLIFAFNPFHLAHAMHHLNISSIQLLPFLLLIIYKAAKSKKNKYIIFASLILATNFYLCYYIFLFGIVIIFPLIFFKAQDDSGNSNYIFIRPVIMTLIIGTIIILPLAIPMAREIISSHPEKIAGHQFHVIDLIGFFFPHRYHWTNQFIINYLVNQAYKTNFWESAAFLGYFILPIALWSAIKSKLVLKKYFIMIGILGFLLSLGSVLTVLGKSLDFVKLPYYLIEKIPGLNAARSPGRFVVLCYFSLSIFIAYAADRWLIYLKQHGRKVVMSLGVTVFILAIFLDYWSAPFEITAIKMPAFYKEIDYDKETFAILDLPMAGWKYNERYMYFQTMHQKPIIGGQLARTTDSYFDRYNNLRLTSEELRPLHIKYVIVHKEFYKPIYCGQICEKLKEDLSLFIETDTEAVFRVY